MNSISLCQNVFLNSSLLVIEEGMIRMNIKREKLVFRHDVRSILHIGIAVRGWAEDAMAVKEIRSQGVVANPRRGRKKWDRTVLRDFDSPYYRKCGYLCRKCWKDRCRKEHQWERHLCRLVGECELNQ